MSELIYRNGLSYRDTCVGYSAHGRDHSLVLMLMMTWCCSWHHGSRPFVKFWSIHAPPLRGDGFRFASACGLVGLLLAAWTQAHWSNSKHTRSPLKGRRLPVSVRPWEEKTGFSLNGVRRIRYEQVTQPFRAPLFNDAACAHRVDATGRKIGTAARAESLKRGARKCCGSLSLCFCLVSGICHSPVVLSQRR